MKTLEDGMILYHGSTVEVSSVSLEKCSPNKDFGQGFYVTSSLVQAHHFMPSAIRKVAFQTGTQANHSCGVVSVYRVQITQPLHILTFEEANVDWLHFIAAHRKPGSFPEIVQSARAYDIIAGKIANDQTSRTLNVYLDGLLGGRPGTEMADNLAINLLLPNRLEDQFCFRTANAIASLKFIGSEKYDATL